MRCRWFPAPTRRTGGKSCWLSTRATCAVPSARVDAGLLTSHAWNLVPPPPTSLRKLNACNPRRLVIGTRNTTPAVYFATLLCTNPCNPPHTHTHTTTTTRLQLRFSLTNHKCNPHLPTHPPSTPRPPPPHTPAPTTTRRCGCWRAWARARAGARRGCTATWRRCGWTRGTATRCCGRPSAATRP